eukprot:TRINITY_DN5474_c0_g1_i4.p1 TRINITY_DN5474_c0_g1~~TRINITY_DN5474_c0_g1_i4.p1  ORF type:complete len:318 (-),score=78.13 TRINITY_DN5474_c0_g1_i4:98-1051(-)
MMIPNITLHPAFGKVVFSLFDIFSAALINGHLKSKKIENSHLYAWLFLFNPLVINLSTRGSADILVVYLVLVCLRLFSGRNVFFSSLFYGFAVHFKIYPIIFAPSLLVLFRNKERFYLPTWSQVFVSILSSGTFFGLTYWTYWAFGHEGLFESLLYHVARKDNRHNFSLYSYAQYLTFSLPSSKVVSILTFLPQIILACLITYKFTRVDLSLTWLLLTMVFVTFNKVVTAQYFVWYFSLLPLVVPYLSQSSLKLFAMLVMWLAAELHWNFWAVSLESTGSNTFTAMWIANIIFFFVNVFMIIQVISGYQPRVENEIK